MGILKAKQCLVVIKVMIILLALMYYQKALSQPGHLLNYNNRDFWGRKTGYWTVVNNPFYPYNLYHYVRNKKCGKGMEWSDPEKKITESWVADYVSDNNHKILYSVRNNRIEVLFANRNRNHLKVTTETMDVPATSVPKYSSYCYIFNSNGTLKQEGLYLWDVHPFLDTSDYYNYSIEYDESGRYIGIRKLKFFLLSPEDFYSKDTLKDSNNFRMPEMYSKNYILNKRQSPDNSTIILSYVKRGKKNGYYREFSNTSLCYSIIGQYKNDIPVGVWLFFNKTSGKIEAIVYDISKNKKIEVIKENGERQKLQYKGYMYEIDKNNFIISEGWMLFDDITSDQRFKYSTWIEYEESISRDYRGITIYGNEEGNIVFYDKKLLNNPFRFYPPLYKIE